MKQGDVPTRRRGAGNRYPGVACDVCAYDYLPLLDELEFVPSRYFAQGPEILGHCQKIADHFNLCPRRPGAVKRR